MKHENAFLITSAQNDLLAPSGKAWDLVQATVRTQEIPFKLGRLASAARRAGIPVIHSPVAFPFETMTGFAGFSEIQRMIVGNQLLAAGQPGSEFVAEATPVDGDIVLPPRQGFSAFWAGTLKPYLDEWGVRTLYLAGMLAEGCISSHARDAVENGFQPVVISDAIGSLSPDLLDAACRELQLHTHALLTTEQVLQHWKR